MGAKVEESENTQWGRGEVLELRLADDEAAAAAAAELAKHLAFGWRPNCLASGCYLKKFRPFTLYSLYVRVCVCV